MSAVEQVAYMRKVAAFEMAVGLLYSQGELNFVWNGGVVGWTSQVSISQSPSSRSDPTCTLKSECQNYALSKSSDNNDSVLLNRRRRYTPPRLMAST
jgi:hypothetical protein